MTKQISSFEASCIELQNDPVHGQILLNFKNAQSLQLTWKYSSMTSKWSAEYFCCFFSFSTAVQRSDKTSIKLEEMAVKWMKQYLSSVTLTSFDKLHL